jgi:hypothetical protein
MAKAAEHGALRLGHAVEHLRFDGALGDLELFGQHHRVGQRPQVVAAEGGPEVLVVLEQGAREAFVVGVGV